MTYSIRASKSLHELGAEMSSERSDDYCPDDWLQNHRVSLKKFINKQRTREAMITCLVRILITADENKHRRYCAAEMLMKIDKEVDIDSEQWGPRGLIRARFSYQSIEIWIPKPPPFPRRR